MIKGVVKKPQYHGLGAEIGATVSENVYTRAFFTYDTFWEFFGARILRIEEKRSYSEAKYTRVTVLVYTTEKRLKLLNTFSGLLERRYHTIP